MALDAGGRVSHEQHRVGANSWLRASPSSGWRPSSTGWSVLDFLERDERWPTCRIILRQRERIVRASG
jgi:hypothetical protein